jgi:hypothetical protein
MLAESFYCLRTNPPSVSGPQGGPYQPVQPAGLLGVPGRHSSALGSACDGHERGIARAVLQRA